MDCLQETRLLCHVQASLPDLFCSNQTKMQNWLLQQTQLTGSALFAQRRAAGELKTATTSLLVMCEMNERNVMG